MGSPEVQQSCVQFGLSGSWASARVAVVVTELPPWPAGLLHATAMSGVGEASGLEGLDQEGLVPGTWQSPCPVQQRLRGGCPICVWNTSSIGKNSRDTTTVSTVTLFLEKSDQDTVRGNARRNLLRADLPTAWANVAVPLDSAQ